METTNVYDEKDIIANDNKQECQGINYPQRESNVAERNCGEEEDMRESEFTGDLYADEVIAT